MQKSRIEWTDYTLNPIKGLCPVDCKDNQGKSYCYARRMYKRFKWNPEIRFYGVVNLGRELNQISKPSKIFVSSTMELFGEWINPEWLKIILYAAKLYSQHTFIFLTKCPQNLPHEWPRNCHVGVSVTNQHQYEDAIKYLKQVNAIVKFLSIEPLLEHIDVDG